MDAPLVMAGAGHTHLVAMRCWAEQGLKVPENSVLISPGTHAWYSGMMPGLLAGRFHVEQCAVDLRPLADAVGLHLVYGEVSAMNADNQKLVLSNNQSITYQVLSINTGSEPPVPKNDSSVPIEPAKPFANFFQRWQLWRQQPPGEIVVLGGGPAAFELVLALQWKLPTTGFRLICAEELLPGQPVELQRAAAALLREREIECLPDTFISNIRDGQLWSGGKIVAHPDAVVLATGAAPLPWYACSGLATDKRGFLRVDACLQSVNHPQVFISGDACSHKGSQRSGVYAVRQGPTLAHNVMAFLNDRPLRKYQPQPRTLALLATADGGALLSYGKYSISNTALRPLLGFWKDRLDLGFILRHERK